MPLLFFYGAVVGIVDLFGPQVFEQPESIAHPAAENPGSAGGSEDQAEPPEF